LGTSLSGLVVHPVDRGYWLPHKYLNIGLFKSTFCPDLLQYSLPQPKRHLIGQLDNYAKSAPLMCMKIPLGDKDKDLTPYLQNVRMSSLTPYTSFEIQNSKFKI